VPGLRPVAGSLEAMGEMIMIPISSDQPFVPARLLSRLALAGGLLLVPAMAMSQPLPTGDLAAPEQVRFYHADSLGSVRAVSDINGGMVSRADYLPFGEQIPPDRGRGDITGYSADAGNRQRFTGKERDIESGLDYFGARYYGSRIGRFTTVDPVNTWRENLDDPQRWNRYAYVRNSPLRYVDPDGRQLAPVTALTTVKLPESQDARTDVAIGLVGGLLMLIPGLEIQANSDAQRAGQVVGMGLGLAAAVSTAPAAAPKGIQANKAAGDAWSKAVGAELKATYEVAVPEITVRTQSGSKTRLDWVTKDSSGAIGCVECKASATAPLTKGQTVTHPEIARTGAVVTGKGKPGVPGGTIIPPTPVQVRRPEE
jgi:RHS repeat-associated protein